MARLKLLQPYDLRPAGAEIDRPGGVADILVRRKIAEYCPPRDEAKPKRKPKKD